MATALFNGGCVVTGAVGIMISISMMRCEQGLNTYTGMFFLMMVDVFNTGMKVPHCVVASTFEHR